MARLRNGKAKMNHNGSSESPELSNTYIVADSLKVVVPNNNNIVESLGYDLMNFHRLVMEYPKYLRSKYPKVLDADPTEALFGFINSSDKPEELGFTKDMNFAFMIGFAHEAFMDAAIREYGQNIMCHCPDCKGEHFHQGEDDVPGIDSFQGLKAAGLEQIPDEAKIALVGLLLKKIIEKK